MIDREKVIKGLECCTFILGKRKCNECPYQKENGCYQLQDDFHALLKEQEAITPKISETATYHNGITSFRRIYSCGSCNGRISGDAAFCQNCGRKVKWNGTD